MNDVIAVLSRVRSFAEQIERYSALIQTMREEGRETLTDEERATLRSRDDEARQRLLEAIEAQE